MRCQPGPDEDSLWATFTGDGLRTWTSGFKTRLFLSLAMQYTLSSLLLLGLSLIF